MAREQAIRIEQEARRGRRHRAKLDIGLRKLGEHRITARLLDISRFGFRVDADRLTVDSMVWLKLPDADPQMARVVWSDHQASGCVFVEMLPAELFRAVLRQEAVEAIVLAGPWPVVVEQPTQP